MSVCGLRGNKGGLLHTPSKAQRRFPPAGCRQGLAPRRPPDTHFYFQQAAQISLCCFLRPQNRLAASLEQQASETPNTSRGLKMLSLDGVLPPLPLKPPGRSAPQLTVLCWKVSTLSPFKG